MVAISLYRGNLHRVPDVPRRYDMPPPNLSLNDFKNLLNRRNAALSRIPSLGATTSSDPNPNPNSFDINDGSRQQLSELEMVSNGNVNNNHDSRVEDLEQVVDAKDLDAGNFLDKVAEAHAVEVDEKPLDPKKPIDETTDKVDAVNEREKRKRDVEEELEVLNAKKHKLVLVLKQILNVEEELKRRNTLQGMAARPSVSFQADATNDLGSPSSESPLRRTPYIQQNVVAHPSRAALGVSSSPSRFAPPGQQGHSGFPPTVSISGTNYIPSSPSPAASGGTPVFRDARQPSPWN